MNLYDGCESNEEIIYSFTSLDFYDKLEKRQNEILSQGKKVVFVESNTHIRSGAHRLLDLHGPELGRGEQGPLPIKLLIQAHK